MSLLPEVIDGKLVIEEPKLSVNEAVARMKSKYVPHLPTGAWRTERPKRKTQETNLEELNNMGRKPVSEDFSDSPFADRQPLNEE